MDKLIALLNIYRSLSAAEAEILADCFQQKYFKANEYLTYTGDICTNLYFIVDGVLRIVAINDKGLDITHFFIKEGQFCTILDSFEQGSPAGYSIQASSSVSVLEIRKGNFLKLYQKLPFMESLMAQINQQRLLEKIRLKNTYSGEDAITRYSLFLAQQPDIINRVPLNHIASYLNVTPQSLSRIRRSSAND